MHNNAPLHGECQPGKLQQKPFTALGCLLGRRLWRMLSNHGCAYMQYKCRVFRALPVIPDVHSSCLYFSVRVSHAVQLFMGFTHSVFGGSCCAQLLLRHQDNRSVLRPENTSSVFILRGEKLKKKVTQHSPNPKTFDH